MANTLPGTVIQADLGSPDPVEAILSPLFLLGGLMLSQVAQLTGLETHVIQNWVRRGFVSPPEKKKYTRRQFCRIAIVGMLKDCLQLDKICVLLSYINGQLDDESDDLMDDAQLYGHIVQLIAQVDRSPMAGEAELKRWCDEALSAYNEPVPGARDRVEKVLQIILTAWLAGRLKREAEVLLSGLT